MTAHFAFKEVLKYSTHLFVLKDFFTSGAYIWLGYKNAGSILSPLHYLSILTNKTMSVIQADKITPRKSETLKTVTSASMVNPFFSLRDI